MTTSRNIRVVFWNRGWHRAWVKYAKRLTACLPAPERFRSEKTWERYMRALKRMEDHGRE